MAVDHRQKEVLGLPPEVKEQLLRCSRCGFCLNNCPTYRVTYSERFVARGRNMLAQSLWADPQTATEGYIEPLMQCLLCGACTVTCPSGVETNEVMVRARQRAWQLHGRPSAFRLFFDHLLPNPRLMRRVAKLVAFGKRTGLSTLARRFGLLRWINARLEGAEALVETMPRRFLRDRLKALGFERTQRGGIDCWHLAAEGRSRRLTVLYFIGCGTNFQLPDSGEAAIRLLHTGGCDVLVAENVCCGLPPYAYGDIDAARRLAAINAASLAPLGADLIVSECGSCTSFLRKYAQLLGAEGERISKMVRDFTEIAVELSLPRLSEPLPVTYHDPCHLVRGQGIVDQPRELLRRAGCEVVELHEADWCCGGAGTYNIMHPDLSLRILERKMSNISAAGVPVVATACPACIIQLRYGARRFGIDVQVVHVAEVLARALEE